MSTTAEPRPRLPKKLPLDQLGEIVLKHGSHTKRVQGVCALEAAAWLAGEQHSDHPSCVCPVISAFAGRWNDDLTNDDDRTRLLRPLLPVILEDAVLDRGRKRSAPGWSSTGWCAR